MILVDTGPTCVKLGQINAISVKVVPICVDFNQIRAIGAQIAQSIHDSIQV